MRFSLVFCALLAMAIPARADVIGAGWHPPSCPPVSCPRATTSMGAGSHSGCSPGCSPNAECGADADCAAQYGEGAICVPTRFCIGTVHVSRLGERPALRGQCSADGTCTEGTCSIARRCNAPPPAPPAPAPTKERPSAPPAGPRAEQTTSNGCAIAAAPSAWCVSWVVALLVVLRVRDRERRRILRRRALR